MGRRPRQAEKITFGGCAYLDAIHGGGPDRYKTRGARLWVKCFAEQDVEGKVHLHDLTIGKWVAGMMAQEGEGRRMYVVTLRPALAESPYERWPYIESD